MNCGKSRRGGFTLVELIIGVVALLLIIYFIKVLFI